MTNKVNKNKTFEYEEEVRDFTGLIFHCPACNEEFHLHIATVDVKKFPLKEKKWKYVQIVKREYPFGIVIVESTLQ